MRRGSEVARLLTSLPMICLGAFAHAQAGAGTRLQIAPRAGETFRAEVVIATRELLQDSTTEGRLTVHSWFERTAESVDSRGRITWVNRLLRFVVEVQTERQSLKLDSANEAERAEMDRNPAWVELRQALGKPLRFQQDKNGTNPASNLPPDNYAVVPLLGTCCVSLPDRQVAQLERWALAQLADAPDEYGTLVVDWEGQYLVSMKEKGDDIARIAIHQTATHSPDRESPMRPELLRYVGGGMIALSQRRGRFTSFEIKTRATYRVTRQGRTTVDVAETNVSYKETP